jgi:hypothetical protein
MVDITCEIYFSNQIKSSFYLGQLTRSTFHTKAFVDEMCRMICEANSQQAKNMQLLTETPNRNFHEFSIYFGEK